MIQVVFRDLCPNCGGEISAARLDAGLPCERCLPQLVPPDQVCAALFELGTLKGFKESCTLRERVQAYEAFFRDAIGSRPWSLQVTWAKRVLKGRSFALIAPTGVGKTTFGITMAAFLPGRSYIILPTQLLVQQVARRLREITPRPVLAYTGRGRKAELEQQKERIRNGDFDILVTTHMFLHRNYEALLQGQAFDFLFVDDVDALLKASRNIDRIFALIGFPPEILPLALKPQRTPQEEERLKAARESRKGVLVVSSATTQPRTKRVLLFRELLGFDIQRAATAARNILDLREEAPAAFEARMARAAEVIQTLGGGAFLYLPADLGRAFLEPAVQFLESRGIRAVDYEHFDAEAQNAFAQGEIQVAVGISHTHNPLIRGVDLPHAVRYVVFAGVPKMLFKTEVSRRPAALLGLLLAMRPLFEDRLRVDRYIQSLRRYAAIREEALERFPRVQALVEEVAAFLQEFLDDPDFRRRVEESDEVGLTEREGEY